MSKAFSSFSLVVLLGLSTILASGQDVNVTINLDFKSPIVRVTGTYSKEARRRNPRNLAFLRSAVGVDNLASRISDVRLIDRHGQTVSYKKLVDGEYLADADFIGWSYHIDLTPLKNRNAAAHASWLSGAAGILMLADILPLSDGQNSVKLRFGVPPTFDVGTAPLSSIEREVGDSYEVEDPDNAIFYVGYGWESGYSLAGENSGRLMVLGSFHFSPFEASQMATEITDAYTKMLGTRPDRSMSVAIAKFPVQTQFGEWQAETRGSNVTIVSSDMAFKSQSQQRLHEQLRHEIFHLWFPNGVNLTGNYDWFYEGFALYQSLKLAVSLNRIRFEDFLDTLSRAHRIDSIQTRRTSLLESSRSRFNGSGTHVYARGMLVAFLSDLAILQNSKGKESIEGVLRQLYSKHRKPAAPVDGNTAAIEMLRSYGGVDQIVNRYVSGGDKIEWDADLDAAGLEDGDAGAGTSLRLKPKLSGRQKTVLDKLGYNNWRKLSR